MVTSVTPLSSISLESWSGAQMSAFWPTMSITVTTSWPQGSAVHLVSTLSPWRISILGTRVSVVPSSFTWTVSVPGVTSIFAAVAGALAGWYPGIRVLRFASRGRFGMK